ncbi:hypothetical protein [Flavobacterium silvaticum]|uniref:Hydrolase n=1 Tax=Flavobacterium silvaticum TaxID=1852020 RepID=A0A972FIT3_9FLAO|nr:hypothetical protein [Flavobacterium silvaticum]NMH26799.1 hypothetical protein [Flavobacterium silvaticum]
MKKSLFLYLFILAVVMNVFTYAYFSKQHESDVMKTESKLKKANDSILVLYNDLIDANYFSLEYNQNAQDNMDTDPKQVIKLVTNEILEMNSNVKGNPLIPYDQINEQKFIINKVRVLNHRWVIADYTDGKMWGELLLKYFIEDNGKLTFERMDTQLYAKQ